MSSTVYKALISTLINTVKLLQVIDLIS